VTFSQPGQGSPRDILGVVSKGRSAVSPELAPCHRRGREAISLSSRDAVCFVRHWSRAASRFDSRVKTDATRQSRQATPRNKRVGQHSPVHDMTRLDRATFTSTVPGEVARTSRVMTLRRRRLYRTGAGISRSASNSNAGNHRSAGRITRHRVGRTGVRC
jgi:hypothetical protein